MIKTDSALHTGPRVAGSGADSRWKSDTDQSAAVPKDDARIPAGAMQAQAADLSRDEAKQMLDDAKRMVAAETNVEDYLTLMREHLIAAKWAWAADDDEGALEHELTASIALERAIQTMRKI